MKITESQYNPSFKLYTDMMVHELSKLPKKPGSNEQCESTTKALKAQLTRPKELDFEWLTRPIPKEYLANPNAKTKDELIGKRDFDPTQVAVIEDIRRKGRNTLGASTDKSVSKESRQRAIHAFTYTPAAPLTGLQVMEAKQNELKQIKEYTLTTADIAAALEKETKQQFYKPMTELFLSLPWWYYPASITVASAMIYLGYHL